MGLPQRPAEPPCQGRPVVRAALESEDILEWFRRMPWLPGHSPLQWVREYEDYLFEQWTHGTFDDDWRQLGFYTEGFYDVYADVPMIHMSSWYDPYPRAVTENYLGLAKRKQVRSGSSWVLGPMETGPSPMPGMSISGLRRRSTATLPKTTWLCACDGSTAGSRAS